MQYESVRGCNEPRKKKVGNLDPGMNDSLLSSPAPLLARGTLRFPGYFVRLIYIYIYIFNPRAQYFLQPSFLFSLIPPLLSPSVQAQPGFFSHLDRYTLSNSSFANFLSPCFFFLALSFSLATLFEHESEENECLNANAGKKKNYLNI